MRSFDVISRSCNGFFVRSILTDVGSRVVYFSVDVVAILCYNLRDSYISSFMGKNVALRCADLITTKARRRARFSKKKTITRMKIGMSAWQLSVFPTILETERSG